MQKKQQRCKRNNKDAKETTKQQKKDNRQDVTERRQERGPHWVVHASCRRFNSAGPHPMCLTLRPADSMHIRGEKRQGGEKHERKKKQKDCPHLFLPGFSYLFCLCHPHPSFPHLNPLPLTERTYHNLFFSLS